MLVTIGFSRPKGSFKIFSEAIRCIERREFSHAYIVIDDMVYHAAHGLVHSVSLENFNADNVTVLTYDINVTDDQHSDGMKFLKKTLGVKYGFLQIIGILIQKIFRKTEPIILNNTQTMICSELCARCLDSVGIEIDVPFDSITPSDLQIILEANYGKIK